MVLKLFLTFILLSLVVFASSFPMSVKTEKVFAVNLKCVIKPARRDEFMSVIKKDQTLTLETEPNALQFVVGEDTTSPNTFHLHEEYIGEEGFNEHLATSHFAEWEDFVKSEPFTEDPTIEIYYGTHIPEKVPPRKAFCLNVKICVQEDKRDEFLKVIENNAKGSINEESLCLQYVYGESKDEKNTFFFHEQYDGAEDGKEGFDAHASTPHFKVWEDFAANEPFTSTPIVSFYRPL